MMNNFKENKTSQLMKRCFYSVRAREIKITMRNHFISTRLAEVKKVDKTNCWRGCGSIGTRILLVRVYFGSLRNNEALSSNAE